MLYDPIERDLQLLAQSCPVSGLCLTKVGGSLGALPPPASKTYNYSCPTFRTAAFNSLNLSMPHILGILLIFIWKSCIP